MVPVGTILAYGGSVSSASVKRDLQMNGWLICDGGIYESGAYKKLSRWIGGAFGKAGGGEFRVPDLRGRFVRGVDHEAGRDPDAANRTAENGGNPGNSVGSLQEDGLKSHQHSLSNTINKFTRRFQGAKNHDDNGIPLIPDAGTVWLEKETSLYGEQETRPKNVYVNFIIKAK